MLRSLEDCPCSCHQTGAVHIVACCTGVSKYGIPAIKPYDGSPYATEQMDIHKYRPAIHKDCIIGTCSMNNCLYPSCTKEPKPNARPYMDATSQWYAEAHRAIEELQNV